MKNFYILPFLLPLAASADIRAIPHPATPLSYEQTVVWCPLFQATWDKLKETAGPLSAVEPPNELISRLEEFRWGAAETMPDGSWKTWSGPASQDFVDGVNKEAAGMTGETTGPFKLLVPDPLGIAAFGLLDREMEFVRELHRSRTIPLRFKGGGEESDVSFFGTKGSTGFVEVLSWQPESRSHAVRIRCKDPADSVILWLPPENITFTSACGKIQEWITGYSDDTLQPLDQIRIPYLELETVSDFSPMMGGVINFERKKGMRVVQAEQITRFKLHEKGAKVRSEASIAMNPFGGPPEPKVPPPPRDFIYDRPFFVFLWKRGAGWPYFGAWIGDAGSMESFKP